MIKILSFRIIFHLFAIIFLSVTSYATQHEYKIEVYDTGQQLRFVDSQGYIEHQYKERLTYSINVSLNTESWKDFKEDLKNKQIKSMVAENAARIFFESFGYKIHENIYNKRMVRLKASQDTLPVYGKFYLLSQYICEKGIDNGIAGLYILQGKNLNNLTYILINEGKFRDKLSLSTLDFGTINIKEDKVRQSHSVWNRERFNILWSKILKYDDIKMIRTATLLDREGTLKLYQIRDITGPCDYFESFPLYKLYPSQWDNDLPNSPDLRKLLNI